MNPKLVHYYNEGYARYTPEKLQSKTVDALLDTNSLSLWNFINSFYAGHGGMGQLKNKDILICGCGLGGIAFRLGPFVNQIIAIDISELAISGANDIAKGRGINNTSFIASDITRAKVNSQSFDLIIDNHLLHCLTDNNKRREYLRKLNTLLKEDGLVFIESMTFNDQLQEPLNFDLKEDYTLWQSVKNDWLPVRKVLPSLALESELLASDLNINTFYYHDELVFNVFPDIPNYPEFRLPKTIRITLNKG